MVELVFGKVKTTDQRLDGAIARVQGDKRAFHLGQLGDFPAAFGSARHADDGARADTDIGRRFVGQARLRGLEALAGNFQHFAAGALGDHALGLDLNDYRREHVAIIRALVQGLVDGVFHLLGVGGQRQEFLWAPVNLAALKVHDAAAQSLVSRLLLRAHQRGDDV